MAGLFESTGWLLPLARRLLYTWVRTTVFPARTAELGIDPGKPLCYVLQDRHFSNTLLLAEEARRAGLPLAETPLYTGQQRLWSRSFFFLRRQRALLDGPPAEHRHSPLLVELIRQGLANPSLDVQLVPVVILWGRAPRQQESILKALFSENWRPPGAWRQLLTILLHGRNVLVRFNSPLSLRGLLQDGMRQEQAVRKLARVLRVHFRRQREMAIGPDLSHRHTQIDTVLSAERVQTAMAAEAQKKGIRLTDARARARHYAMEIVSDYSYGVLRALELLLDWLWTRLYDGIAVHNIDTVTQIASGNAIVYVPCHRSHIDYLLLSYLIHRHGLTPPHIAAGANLNLPLVGRLLRHGGAFFLRRSIKGEALYAAVFDEYLHLMLARGFPIEYFIEGGRSRGGRMLPPKAGILGMTVNSFIREHHRPLVFVPVYIGYEKLIEGKTYVGELAGRPKQRESLLALFKTARQIKRVFGLVHVNFGRPLPLTDFLDLQHPGWQSIEAARSPVPDWSRQATRRAAAELATRINEAAVLNPVNLIALVLLATPRKTADEQSLHRLLDHYLALARDARYAAATIGCTLAAKEIVAYSERLHIVERFHDPLGDLIRIPEEQAPLLAYFRNNVLHLFAVPAVIACLLSHNSRLEPTRMRQAVSGICLLMRAELFLPWSAEQLPTVIETVVGVLLARGLLRRSLQSGCLDAPDPVSREFDELRCLGETVRPLLERHFLTLALLHRQGSGQITRQVLETDCQQLAHRLALLYEFNNAEYPDKATFSAFIGSLIDAEVLQQDADGRLHFDARLTVPLSHAELVLPTEARQAIRRMTHVETTGLHLSDNTGQVDGGRGRR